MLKGIQIAFFDESDYILPPQWIHHFFGPTVFTRDQIILILMNPERAQVSWPGLFCLGGLGLNFDVC